MPATKTKSFIPQSITLIWPLIRLTLMLVGVQIVAVMFNFGGLLSATPVTHFIGDEIFESIPVLSGLGYFVLAQCLLYGSFIFIIWLIARLIGRLFHLRTSVLLNVGLLLWADAVILVFLLNQFFFPNSQFAKLLRMLGELIPAFHAHMTTQSLHTAIFIFGGLFLLAAATALTCLIMLALRNIGIVFIALLLGALAAGAYYYHLHHGKPTKTTPVVVSTASNKPNVVFISMDYFRPGDTVYYGNKQEITPNVDQFLTQATVFKYTLSAIARTFPSLMSVESGSYPKQNGARHNLILPSLVNHQNTLGHILQQQGYYTMLATDGSHFFYMDPSYGFNTVMAPTPGFNEFLLSSINDFPLSNLVVNSELGKRLFPYNYMNRNANTTYTPATFNKELTQTLAERPTNKPIYIHIHLTLAAWPYSWDAAMAPMPKGLDKAHQAQFRFNAGLRAVDTQFAEVMHILRQDHILDNAMLVVFSDHGQAFGEEGDRITETKNYVGTPNNGDIRRFTNLRNAIGHGTDVLSLKQAHPLLAFKIYGGAGNQVGARELLASLIDISPTVLNYLNVSSATMQGVSLLPEITSNRTTGVGNRTLFLETEFTLPSVMAADPSISKVLAEGLAYYQLDKKTGMMEVRPSFTKLIIKGKQRAAINGEWMLAMYPNAKKPATLVLVNLKNRQWTTDMQSNFAQNSPLTQLWDKLDQFYGNEVAVPLLPMPMVKAMTTSTLITPATGTKPAVTIPLAPVMPMTEKKLVSPVINKPVATMAASVENAAVPVTFTE